MALRPGSAKNNITDKKMGQHHTLTYEVKQSASYYSGIRKTTTTSTKVLKHKDCWKIKHFE